MKPPLLAVLTSPLADAFAAAVPEPQTWALLLLGLAAVAGLQRRRSLGRS